jgi:hypothetical protein
MADLAGAIVETFRCRCHLWVVSAEGFEIHMAGKGFTNTVLERLRTVSQESAAAERRRAELAKRSPNIQPQRWNNRPFIVKFLINDLRSKAACLAALLIAGGLSEVTTIPFIVLYIPLMVLVIWDGGKHVRRRWGMPEKRGSE